MTIITFFVFTVALIWLTAVGIVRLRRGPSAPSRRAVPAKLDKPVTKPSLPDREMPSSFPRNTYMPNKRESVASGSVDLPTFSPGRYLIHVDDDRVWWESDNDEGDDEDDHTMHKSMEAPILRLIELVAERGATLKVQDAYRPSGTVHGPKSLHKEGRGIDLTCDEMSLEELARLSWVAGFDWVYHEGSAKGGDHVHCSVKR